MFQRGFARGVGCVALAALWGAGCGDEGPGAFAICLNEIDGVFTGWPGCEEYETVKPGVYGDLYLEYEQGLLYVLNDWFVRDDAPVHRDAYNLFELSTGDGTEHWDIKVYGDGRTAVLFNGEEYADFVEGGHGFAKSPRHDFDHALFEFSIPCSRGDLSMKEKDPAPGTVPPDATITQEDAENALMEEPTVWTGVLTGEGAVVEEARGPVIAWLSPNAGRVGDKVELHGFLFGDEPGEVRFGSKGAEIVAWSDQRIVARVPAGLRGESTSVVVVVDSEKSNGVAFGCASTCDGSNCGNDGCGGICECPSGQACIDAMCVCPPACDGKTCGGDGCGGVCGECGGAEVCADGNCCLPQCEGKGCGDDACGGVCGTCSASEVCVAGTCCVRQCDGSNCGDDGCGGVCGVCADPGRCIEGTCCTPQCEPRDRGMTDGCGGICP